jgi:hypothetical protein
VGFQYILQHFSLGIVGQWGTPWQWIFTFFAWDFCFYWLHRTHHKLPFLWNIHVIHHQGEHFSLSLGIRNSWYSSLSSFPFFVVLAVLGVPLEQFITIGAVHYFIQFYNHNRVVNKSGWLEYIMITPAHHRVHHGCNDDYIDKNCGGTLVIWDKIFGTFQAEKPHVPVQYGVKGNPSKQNPFWANNLPFLQYFNLPQPQKVVLNTKTKPLPDFFIACGGLVLFGALLYYIYMEHKWASGGQFGLFALLFGGTIAMAGLFEKYLWGVAAWVGLGVVANAFYIYYFDIQSVVYISLSVLWATHALLALKKVL